MCAECAAAAVMVCNLTKLTPTQLAGPHANHRHSLARQVKRKRRNNQTSITYVILSSRKRGKG
jgi:hypothetical protein